MPNTTTYRLERAEAGQLQRLVRQGPMWGPDAWPDSRARFLVDRMPILGPASAAR